jgi:tetratricopeptide (TPR) repeat protein
MTEHSDDLLHIASCRTCRDRFTADNVVNLDADRHREPERMREFLETARRLEREREGVQDVVARLLRTTPPEEWSALAASPELRSSAAVEQLIEEVRNRAERMPAHSLTLANVATSIAEALPATTYPAVVLAQLRATAWKERAHTLRYLGRFDDALAAIETAEECLNRFAAAAFDRAVIHLAKAMILYKVQRGDEANELLRLCRQVFEEHGDSKMLLSAGMIEGGFLFHNRRHAEAQNLFHELRDVAHNVSDTESLARIENNLGYCAIELGDFRIANMHFSNSIALFNDGGRALEATRAEWGAGRLLVAKGQINAGMAYLRSARAAFTSAELAEDAARCGLEIVETLVNRGDSSAARDLAHQIAGEVAAAGLSHAAVTALEQLEEGLREGETELGERFRNVHAFLEPLHEPSPT